LRLRIADLARRAGAAAELAAAAVIDAAAGRAFGSAAGRHAREGAARVATHARAALAAERSIERAAIEGHAAFASATPVGSVFVASRSVAVVRVVIVVAAVAFEARAFAAIPGWIFARASGQAGSAK
jgi:hypothetical protein